MVALNAERAEEEKRGIIRWLRPEYQNPEGATETQQEMAGMAVEASKGKEKAAKQPWPKSLAEQAQAVGSALASLSGPASVEDVARCFKRAKRDRVAEILETLVLLGQARIIGSDKFASQ